MNDATTLVPAEWAPQKAIWTAWPADPDEWNGDLATPRRDVAAMVRALSDSNTVRLLVNGEEAEQSARAALNGAAEFVPARYGDIWLRDTGPIFATTAGGKVALRFTTNSWGGKYDLPDDATVGDDIARFAATFIRRFGFVSKAARSSTTAQGTMLTTRQMPAQPQPQRLDQGAGRGGTRTRRSAPGKSSGSTKA